MVPDPEGFKTACSQVTAIYSTPPLPPLYKQNISCINWPFFYKQTNPDNMMKELSLTDKMLLTFHDRVGISYNLIADRYNENYEGPNPAAQGTLHRGKTL